MVQQPSQTKWFRKSQFSLRRRQQQKLVLEDRRRDELTTQEEVLNLFQENATNEVIFSQKKQVY